MFPDGEFRILSVWLLLWNYFLVLISSSVEWLLNRSSFPFQRYFRL